MDMIVRKEAIMVGMAVEELRVKALNLVNMLSVLLLVCNQLMKCVRHKILVKVNVNKITLNSYRITSKKNNRIYTNYYQFIQKRVSGFHPIKTG